MINTEKLIHLPNGCWLAGDILFAPNYFEKYENHKFSAAARAILQAEKTGKQIRITPLFVHNLKGK